jgi:membrane protein YqaA with SNARE-associated domain
MTISIWFVIIIWVIRRSPDMRMAFLAWPASVWGWIHGLGPVGLLLLGIADNAPMFSTPAGAIDIFVILLSAGSHRLWPFYALMAASGEVLGGYLTYRVAEKGGQKTLEKKLGQARAEKIYSQFEKHGFIAILGGAIAPPPFPFTTVLMAAGIMQYPRQRFFIALAAGRAIRFLAEAFLARSYGGQMIAFFSRHYREAVDALVVLAAIAGIGALIYFKYFRTPKKEGRQTEKSI